MINPATGMPAVPNDHWWLVEKSKTGEILYVSLYKGTIRVACEPCPISRDYVRVTAERIVMEMDRMEEQSALVDELCGSYPPKRLEDR